MGNCSAQHKIKSCSDAVLVQEIKEGSNLAFEEITRRYQGLIGSISTRYCATGFDRADFMQEGLMALHNACKAYDPHKSSMSFRNFAAVCIGNRFLSVIRKDSAKGTIPKDAIVSIDDIELWDNNSHNPELMIEQQESAEDLNKMLRDILSRLESDVLRMYLQGMQYAQIAKKLGVSVKAVDNALQRIRKKVSAAKQ